VTPDAIAAWSSVFLVLVTGALVLATYFLYRATAKSASAAIESVHEMRRAREQEAMPYVIFQVEHRLDAPVSDARLRNIGQGPAFDIKCDFEPDFPYPTDVSRKMSDLALVKGLGLLAPGDEFRFIFGPTADILKEDSTTPKSFAVNISFQDSFGKSYGHTVSVDIAESTDVYYTPIKTLKHIDDRLQELRRIFDKIERNLRQTLRGEEAEPPSA